MLKKTAFTTNECRRSLAEFSEPLVAYAVSVARRGRPDQIEAMTHGNEECRALFWVNEWMAAEHIDPDAGEASELIADGLSKVRSIRRDASNWNAHVVAAVAIGLAVILGLVAIGGV